MTKIVKHVMLDILRNRFVIAYAILMAAVTLSMFNMNDNHSKGLLGLANIMLLIVPLVSIVFASIYLYNASDFIELLLAQPIERRRIWMSLFAGLSLSMSTAFTLGCGIPMLFLPAEASGGLIVAGGVMLTVAFTGIAILTAVHIRDKAKGIGTATLTWLFFTLLYDGMVLFLLFQFMDYPMEKPILLLTLLNPIDLTRTAVLLRLDMPAMMGVTSAVFHDVFGTAWGMAAALGSVFLWTILPLWASLRTFRGKDI